MTAYIYSNGDIQTDNKVVGWINTAIPNQFECVSEIKKILEAHQHTLSVLYFRLDFEKPVVEPCIRESGAGQYISGKYDDINYAYFSNDMNCAKLCANAVFKELTA